ncbi:MAG: WGxxGxxG family protein [Limnoraphis robusta]|uniref:WGxxGxxG-CTERM domain-containing protein n=1 Tax=Limnoraphis robusta CS-951 TaxID=1637645 RepID=A0A0F5YF19_9CYAN|nr:WGxxGxxG family protein [Limnoraphis robusta]KKD37504.1 hypothetical protein WN50_14010 [Limnoraphis robusta CS-951]
MKFSNLTKLVGVSALSLSLSILPMVNPASAQTGTTDDRIPTTNYVESDDDFDWGWLGLLGLAGLAGLAGKKRDNDDVRYREPNVTRTGTTTGYRE